MHNAKSVVDIHAVSNDTRPRAQGDFARHRRLRHQKTVTVPGRRALEQRREVTIGLATGIEACSNANTAARCPGISFPVS